MPFAYVRYPLAIVSRGWKLSTSPAESAKQLRNEQRRPEISGLRIGTASTFQRTRTIPILSSDFPYMPHLYLIVRLLGSEFGS